MIQQKGLLIGAAALLALLWIARKAKAAPPLTGSATLGPLMPVGPIGNVDPNAPAPVSIDRSIPEVQQAQVDLCMAAPLNSFGPACKGISWMLDTDLQPVDLRARPVPVPDRTPLIDSAFTPASAFFF